MNDFEFQVDNFMLLQIVGKNNGLTDSVIGMLLQDKNALEMGEDSINEYNMRRSANIYEME